MIFILTNNRLKSIRHFIRNFSSFIPILIVRFYPSLFSSPLLSFLPSSSLFFPLFYLPLLSCSLLFSLFSYSPFFSLVLLLPPSLTKITVLSSSSSVFSSLIIFSLNLFSFILFAPSHALKDLTVCSLCASTVDHLATYMFLNQSKVRNIEYC